MITETYTVEIENVGKRLDVYLSEVLVNQASRSQIKKMIDSGEVLIEGKQVSAHYKVKENDRVDVEFAPSASEETRAEKIPLDIIFEDDDLILINKPAGMVVHPACGNPRHTLVNALLFHFQSLSTVGGPIRPGLVHRLDKNTSGIMVIAKNDFAHSFLAKQFKDQTIERTYRVVVRDVVQHNEGFVEEPVGRAFINRKKMLVKPSGGKDAKTYWRVLERYHSSTLLELKLFTGRTHQIRVHMAHINHPVLGDSLYGLKTPGIDRQAVHALKLGFVHPKTKAKMEFSTELPQDIQELIEFLKKE